ncbi:unnamed protein product [marine sediment metagenome]|uniref:Uncharacterized protein n=1 Tax=marine sediment metagenome TaxID=412755 RepID=X0Z9E9_9ZZZZ
MSEGMQNAEYCESKLIKRAIVRAGASLVVTLILQTGALLWWGGQMSARMDYVERGLDTVTQRVHAMEIDR